MVPSCNGSASAGGTEPPHAASKEFAVKRRALDAFVLRAQKRIGLDGQVNVRDAVRRSIAFEQNGKRYRSLGEKNVTFPVDSNASSIDEIIAELEPERRGPYAGAVGCFSFNGNLDTCITIRTMVMKDDTAFIQAGGGIVYDSDPEAEHQETLSKARALLRAIDLAEHQLEARPTGSLGY